MAVVEDGKFIEIGIRENKIFKIISGFKIIE